MRIVCPTCDAEYEVLEHLLTPGRATRCARCAHRWVPLPIDAPPQPPPEDEHPASAEPEPPAAPVAISIPVGPTAMDRLSASVPKPKRKLPLRLAWAASILVLIGFGFGLYAKRAAVTAAWPPSLRLYAALGVASTGETPHRAPEAKHEGAAHVDETGQHPATHGH